MAIHIDFTNEIWKRSLFEKVKKEERQNEKWIKCVKERDLSNRETEREQGGFWEDGKKFMPHFIINVGLHNTNSKGKESSVCVCVCVCVYIH